MNALVFDDAIDIDMFEAEKILNETHGRFFRVDFIKRTNGALRRMVARTGVKPKDPSPDGAKYKASDYGLIRAWDAAVQNYRSIPVEGILGIKFRGRTYRVV